MRIVPTDSDVPTDHAIAGHGGGVVRRPVVLGRPILVCLAVECGEVVLVEVAQGRHRSGGLGNAYRVSVSMSGEYERVCPRSG
jgi:hypothetical protein